MVQSVITVRGDNLSLSGSAWPKVVGVCSVEGGSESVGEVSSSVGSIGEVKMLRSYSSSASESAWYGGGNAMAGSCHLMLWCAHESLAMKRLQVGCGVLRLKALTSDAALKLFEVAIEVVL